MAAYECDSLNFPAPPYPDQIVCPYDDSSQIANVTSSNATDPTDEFASSTTASSVLAVSAISLWAIMSKVRTEAFMWGAGTALGELPPYFMAKLARSSGTEPDSDVFREFEELLEVSEDSEESMGWGTWAKLCMEEFVKQGGFFGILICASIPNPLFDLAGITCGYFLVPFWTFFGATLIGKAIVKMHIQKLFVIFAFSERHAEKIINLLRPVPKIQSPFKNFLKEQKTKFHRKPGELHVQSTSYLSQMFNVLVYGMLLYFVISIINSLAQRYHKRICRVRDLETKKKLL